MDPGIAIFLRTPPQIDPTVQRRGGVFASGVNAFLPVELVLATRSVCFQLRAEPQRESFHLEKTF